MGSRATAKVINFLAGRDDENGAKTQTGSYLLPSGIALLSKDIPDSSKSRREVNDSPASGDYEARRERCRQDCERALAGAMSRMDLRRTYQAEANSHRNML